MYIDLVLWRGHEIGRETGDICREPGGGKKWWYRYNQDTLYTCMIQTNNSMFKKKVRDFQGCRAAFSDKCTLASYSGLETVLMAHFIRGLAPSSVLTADVPRGGPLASHEQSVCGLTLCSGRRVMLSYRICHQVSPGWLCTFPLSLQNIRPAMAAAETRARNVTVGITAVHVAIIPGGRDRHYSDLRAEESMSPPSRCLKGCPDLVQVVTC